MQFLSGWTVQCLNPECPARGHWLRMDSPTRPEHCGSCGSALHNVPPPLAPRFRMRPRMMARYRPLGRPR
jgi:hypothetical protein